MNYRIAKTMLCLCVGYLLAFYVLKFFFPELLLQTITTPTLLQLGEMIERFAVVRFTVILGCSFITFYLFAIASSGRFVFKLYENLIVIAVVGINYAVSILLPELYTNTSTCLMLLLAMLLKGNFSYTIVTFALHGYLSQFLMSIRGFETVIVEVQSIGVLSSFVLCLEIYVWLLLLGIIFYFKEKKENGSNGTALSQQEC